ncbi:MAG: hypothetical protein V1878_00900 [bacterium]
MERDELIRILREALNPASDNAVRARESASKLPPDIADALFIHTISRPIEAVLAKSEPFEGGGFLVQQENGYSGFYANEASIVLSRRVLQGDTPEQAVGWLEKIISTNRANGTGVLAIWGVKIASPVELGLGVTLLPFSALPDSTTKRRFSQSRDPVASPIFPSFLGLIRN